MPSLMFFFPNPTFHYSNITFSEGVKMPNKVGRIYVCEICGNKVEMVVAGKGTLHCCGQPMKLAGEKK